MSQISKLFTQLKSQQKKALIPYITGGYPNCETTIKLMHQMVESGADIIELGMPFSDPMADGPTIQKANQYALEHNITLNDVLGCVASFRETNTTTPVVLMGYLNPIEQMGYEHFADIAQKAGVDGCLIVDCPPEEAHSVIPHLEQHDMDLVYLIAPNTPIERVKTIADKASGYLYIVAYKGITGSKDLDFSPLQKELAQVQSITELPLAIGFGIKDTISASAAAEISDAVIIGSAIIDIVSEHVEDSEAAAKAVGQFIAEIREAIDNHCSRHNKLSGMVCY